MNTKVYDTRKPVIYLAAPYASPHPEVSVTRVEAVTRFAALLMKEGKAVFSPITQGHEVQRFLPPELAHDHDFWLPPDLAILQRCDMLVILPLPGWRESVEVRTEVAAAMTFNVTVALYKSRAGENFGEDAVTQAEADSFFLEIAAGLLAENHEAASGIAVPKLH